jgi:hypothetical protein
MMDNNATTGEMRFYKGQAYFCAGFKDHERRDGTELTLILWQSLCAVCQKQIEFTAPMHSEKIYPTRRCKKHRAPGIRA